MTDPTGRLVHALADRYAIERKLGSGGMAIVYLARDLKHGREVAVKILRPEIAAEIGTQRFLKEIQTTAQLNHPHVLPLLDSGEAGGFLYYVMPFVAGETLADLLLRERQLPIGDAVRISREVAEALGHAHSYGIVHRDIKPQNILLSGGHAVVADFGIARALSEAGSERLTETGMAVGTPAYMSPEQAMGDPNVDARSDVYSLACVLYEMLVGQIPFTGPSAQAILARHSLDAVPAPHIMRDTIPEELEDIILRALAKSPADRFRTASEFAEALTTMDSGAVHLRRPSRAVPVPRRKIPRRPAVAALLAFVALGLGAWWTVSVSRGGSGGLVADGLDPRNVAVLYFSDLSPQGAFGHVADGLTEGLIDELSRVGALEVVSKNGVAPYRGGEIPRDSVARALRAGSLIEGSVEPLGERVRVVVRLVDGASGADIERASFELPARQLLVVRDSVVGEVARLLRSRLGQEVQLRGRRAGTASVEAWSLVQRAERLRKQAPGLVRESAAAAVATYQQADSLLRLAEATDPKWAEPVALQSQVSWERAFLEQDRDRRLSWLNQSISHATRTLDLERRHAEALALRGRARRALYAMNVTPNPAERARLLDSAEADLKAATNADGTLASAWVALGQLYYDRKDRVAAAIAARKGFEADAFLRNQDANLNLLFWVNYDLEEFLDAQQWCQEGARRFPRDYRFAACQLWLMIAPGATPDIPRAWALAHAVDTLSSGPGQPTAQRQYRAHLAGVIVGGALARAGLADSARRVLAAMRAGRDVDPTGELPGYEAIMRVVLGDHDGAVALLRSYLVGHATHEFTVGQSLHWWWRDLERHPQFREVMRATR